MKIVIPGGTGQVGAILERSFTAAGHDVVILTRRPAKGNQVQWDGVTLGSWAGQIDGCDVVVVRAPDRHRTALEDPQGRAGTAPRRGLRFFLRGLAGGFRGPRAAGAR